jgi:hypothetical protein
VVEFSREKRTEMLNRLREMIGASPVPVIGEPAPVEEIPEDAPGYLNPEVLEGKAGDGLPKDDIFGEERPSDAVLPSTETVTASRQDQGNDAGQSPEKMEEILNSGMAFLGGLMEMATGRKMAVMAGEEKMVQVDGDTGEVTLKFKLPGF